MGSQLAVGTQNKLFALVVTSTLLAVQPVVADEAPVSAPTAPVAEELAVKVFPNMGALIKSNPGKLPLVRGSEYEGTSLLPFGSRDRAMQEAKDNAKKSGYKTFVVTYDRQERMTKGLGTGIFQVVKIQGVELVDKSVGAVMQSIEAFSRIPELRSILVAALKEPEFAEQVPQFKSWVQRDEDQMPSGVAMSEIVKAIVLHEGKLASEQLKKWAKFHRSADVRAQSMKALLQFGETDLVEDMVKSEKDKFAKLALEEAIRKIRMSE